MSLEFSIKTPIFVLSQIYEKNEPRGSLTTYELRTNIRWQKLHSFRQFDPTDHPNEFEYD